MFSGFLFFRYLWEVIFHKYCIILAGIHVNKILNSTSYNVSHNRLILHDLSKFSKSEFWPYANYFFGGKKNGEEFHRAWLHHVENNDHHWEHFIQDYPSVAKNISRNDTLEGLIIREMPDEAILEMIADNLAASRSYEGYWPDGNKKDGWKWMTNSYEKHRLHPTTRIKFGAFLCALGYARVLPREYDWSLIDKASLSNEEKSRLWSLKTLAALNN